MKRILSLFIGLLTFVVTATAATAETPATDKIVLTVDSCNVRVEISESGQFEYLYDAEKYALTTTDMENTLTINFSRTADTIELLDMVLIKIPAKEYDEIIVRGTKSGISLPKGIDADFDISSESGAVSIGVEKGFAHNIDLTCTGGSGTLVFDKDATDYTLAVNAEKSAVSAELPNFVHNRPYVYSAGSGVAKITLNIQDSAFSINTASS
jgi:hypothetical protein